MKYYFHIVTFFLIFNFAKAQQDARMSLQMFNIVGVNPAASGSTDFVDIMGDFRQQNVGNKQVKGHPSDIILSANAPIKKISSGVGLNYIEESIGFEKNIIFEPFFAYQLSLGEGKLGFGLNATLGTRKFDFSDAIYPGDNQSGDILINRMKDKQFNSFGLGAGLYYRISGLYFGLSGRNINNPKYTFQENIDSSGNKLKYQRGHYYVNAGYEYQTNNPLFTFLPSLQVKSAGARASQITGSFLVHYNKSIIG
ncbi:MAG: PorP/SprF family type IX secretion system membrane protein, partial [Bacteroidales bacterium]